MHRSPTGPNRDCIFKRRGPSVDFSRWSVRAVDSPLHCFSPKPWRWSGVAIETFANADHWGVSAAAGAESNDGSPSLSSPHSLATGPRLGSELYFDPPSSWWPG
jgi:hypothetical protein